MYRVLGSGQMNLIVLTICQKLHKIYDSIMIEILLHLVRMVGD
jgi:hypothetical protein